jgi:5-methylcytosine-specific restriction endonuclease McrA
MVSMEMVEMARPLTPEQKTKKKIADAARYARDREKAKAAAKAWKDRNKEHVTQYKNDYRASHAAEITEYNDLSRGQRAEWREAHREEAISYAKQYRESNKELVAQKRREKYLIDRDEIKEKQRKWYYANKDCARQYARLHRMTRKDLHAIYAQNKRIRKRQGEGRLSVGIVLLLMVEQGHRCPYCLTDLRRGGYHIDHYVPLALGGPHQDSNVQLTCPACNARKGSKHPIDFLFKILELRCELGGASSMAMGATSG